MLANSEILFRKMRNQTNAVDISRSILRVSIIILQRLLYEFVLSVETTQLCRAMCIVFIVCHYKNKSNAQKLQTYQHQPYKHRKQRAMLGIGYLTLNRMPLNCSSLCISDTETPDSFEGSQGLRQGHLYEQQAIFKLKHAHELL